MAIFPFEFTEFIDMKNNPLLKKFLFEKELPCIYGYTVDFNNRRVSSLLMVSTIPTCVLDSEQIVQDSLLEYIATSEVIIKHGRDKKNIKVKKLWKKRIDLARKLNVPLYIVFWNEKKVYLINILEKEEEISIENIEHLTWEDFAEKMKNLKSVKRQAKELMYVETPPFEKRLLNYGVSGPGDLDGFEITTEDNRIIFYEFSTRNLPCERLKKHDPNKFMDQDFRRWMAPMILKNQVPNSSINLVIWSPCCQEEIIIWEDIELKRNSEGKFGLRKKQIRYYS